MVFLLFISFLYILLYPHLSFAQIRINEFSVDKTPQQVEIVNISSESADVSSWYIDDAGGTTYFTIPSQTFLFPQACMVFSSDFNFNKASSDIVRLFNASSPPTSSSSQLVDSFSYSSSPKNETLSFYRLPDGDGIWKTGTASLGQYNETTDLCIINPTLTPTPSPTIPPLPTSTPTTIISLTLVPSPTLSYSPPYNNLFISEIMPYPDTNQNEWVELYNAGDGSFEGNIYLDDCEGTGSSPKTFFLSISKTQYATVDLHTSIFNNNQDCVRLLDQNKTLIDDLEYTDPQQGLSIGRTGFDTDSYCVQNPSKGSDNNPCVYSSSSSIKPSPTYHISQKTISASSHASSAKAYSQGVIPSHKTSQVLGLQDNKLNKSYYSNNPKTAHRLWNQLSFCYSALTVVGTIIKIRNDTKMVDVEFS